MRVREEVCVADDHGREERSEGVCKWDESVCGMRDQ